MATKSHDAVLCAHPDMVQKGCIKKETWITCFASILPIVKDGFQKDYMAKFT